VTLTFTSFADVLDEMGAGLCRIYDFPRGGLFSGPPTKVIDEILPGRTCSRDLIGDLAQALSKTRW